MITNLISREEWRLGELSSYGVYELRNLACINNTLITEVISHYLTSQSPHTVVAS